MPDKEIVYFEVFDVVDKNIYAQFLSRNILVKISLDSDRAEVLTFEDKYRYKHCTSKDQKIYFADNGGEAFVIYDITSKKETVYSLESHEKTDNNIVTVERYDECIFIVSQYTGIIYIYDIVNKKLEKDYTLNRFVKKKNGERVECLLKCWKIDGYLYLRAAVGNLYETFRYDLTERYLEKIEGSVFSSEMINTYYYDNKLYILKDNFNLVIWDIKNNAIDTIVMTDLYQLLNADKDGHMFSIIAVTQKNIWLFPSVENEDIYIYDMSGGRISRYDRYPSDFFYLDRKNWTKYSSLKASGNYIYVAARSSNYYLVIDAETGLGTWKTVYVPYSDGYYCNLIDKERKKNGERSVLYEGNIPLKAYLSYSIEESGNAAQPDSIGKDIWEKLK